MAKKFIQVFLLDVTEKPEQTFDQLYLALGLPRWQRICLPTQEMQETQAQFLHWEDPQEEEMETHSSILAWEIPWTEEPGGLQFMGSERVRHS